MPYSSQALDLRKLNVVELPRLSDRISYLFLDKVRIVQDSTGVVAAWEGDNPRRLQIPVAGISILLLGPGTSITAPALGSLSRAGACVIFTDASGMSSYAAARELTGSGEWAQAQARMWANPAHRITAAKQLYARRFPEFTEYPDWESLSLKVLRGMEGHRVKEQYRTHARKAKLSSWRRESGKGDPGDVVNLLLDAGNAVLYGVALAACTALSVNPSLGVIHSGSSRAFLFDLADEYKVKVTIPLAFQAYGKDNASWWFRTRLRPCVLFRAR